MALYYGTNAIVRSPDSDTDPFDISADIFSTLLWLDYLLKISLDHHKTVLRSKNQEVGATQKHTLRMQIIPTTLHSALKLIPKMQKTLPHILHVSAEDIFLHVSLKKIEYI